jgi:hypothetical protein
VLQVTGLANSQIQCLLLAPATALSLLHVCTPQGQHRWVEVEHDCQVSDEDENAAVIASRFASPSLFSSSSSSGVQRWREASKTIDKQSAAKLAELIATAQTAQALGVRGMPSRGRGTEEALQAARERRKDPVCLQLPMPAPKYTPIAAPVQGEGEEEEEEEEEEEVRACRDQVAFAVRDIGLRRFEHAATILQHAYETAVLLGILTGIHTCIHTYIRIYIHTHIHTYINT